MLHTAAIGAAGVLLWAWSRTTDDADWLYRGGLTVTAVLVGVVITSVTAATPGPLGRLLSLGPVRWIGVISYGLYLWHWPVYVVLNRGRTGLDGPALLAVRLACTVAIATLSYYAVELPIRRGAFRGWRIRTLAPATAVVVAAAFVVVTASVPNTGLTPEVANARSAPHRRSRRNLRHRRRRVSCAEFSSVTPSRSRSARASSGHSPRRSHSPTRPSSDAA
jgi:Acyltransferase family